MYRTEKILNEVKRVFSDANEKVYLVGGAVRDLLMQREPKDFDFVTLMPPSMIESFIKQAGRKVYTVGKKFGTLGFTVDGEVIEITTFRQEVYSKGSRKPEVTFCTSLPEDLSRRDFTINAMARDMEGNLEDYHKGKTDLSFGIIRAVGNPLKRFREDPLRMLRAIRFSCQLGFSIDPPTFKAIQEKNYKLLGISKERWMQELNKILMTDKVESGLSHLMESGIINFILPELAQQYRYNQDNPHHNLDLWSHTKRVVSLLPKNLHLRWAGLLHDVAKPQTRVYRPKKGHCSYIKHDLLGAEMVEKLARYLKWSNDMREEVKALVLTHMMEDHPLKEADMGAKG